MFVYIASLSHVFKPYKMFVHLFKVLICYHMSRLGFSLGFLRFNAIHSHVHVLML